MKLSFSSILLLSLSSVAVAQNATNLSSSLNFGTHYAVLNLDLITALVSPLSATPAGSEFISSVSRWIDAVHALPSRPLTIFTRIFFSNARRPEVGPNAPFAKTIAGLGNATADNPITEVFPAFTVDEAGGDVVLQKARFYAGAGNALEEILKTQGIDTVILSGIRTSGVILSTAYHLFDLDYKVYVIANNTIESPPDTPGINDAILAGIIPKLPANVITLDQALAAIARSGPAVY
ncbi:Isochorismatase hydrolase [Rhizodiscina lignyota]|uniref:Isochorismatase hydrolase n=1 Tax=Rhizodiscina lignyota TaxID=1504668 RepID=A0A9P4I9H4_9PEZI|nr:Isochorismatase hydrolase [Rhizodiscina lignyota]